MWSIVFIVMWVFYFSKNASCSTLRVVSGSKSDVVGTLDDQKQKIQINIWGFHQRFFFKFI